jgi:hypothetical protein
MVNREELVFFEELLGDSLFLGHMDENDPKAHVFQFFSSTGDIADGFPAEGTSEETEENQ